MTAKASRPASDKGEDCVFVCELGLTGDFLLGVADGLSMAHGRAAASWIEDAMCSIAEENSTELLNAHVLFQYLANDLPRWLERLLQ